MPKALTMRYSVGYRYGFYAQYTYPITYGANKGATLAPNNHELSLSIGLKGTRFYTAINAYVAQLDSAKALTNRQNIYAIYPKSHQFGVWLSIGYANF